MSDNICLSWL